MSEPILDPELTALQQSLGRLEPQGGVERDAVMYRAGRASARPRRFLPVVAAAAAGVLGFLIGHRPAPEPQVVERVRVVERIVTVAVPAEPITTPVSDRTPALTPDTQASLADQLRRRREVLRWGVEMLPPVTPLEGFDGPPTPADAPRLDAKAGLY
jgi:hypothetical protein